MNTRFLKLGATALVAALAGSVPQAGAQTIFSASSAIVNSGGTESAANITWTHNQGGLFTPYVSGVTNFDAYIAGNPLHTVTYTPFEWFSGVSSTAVVTYDFGITRGLDRFALWNEEFSGIGFLNILGSIDGTTFSTILSGLTPANSPSGVDYGATVYSFGATDARYFRMEMSGCPQVPNDGYNGCSIGEVAFRSAVTTSVVPEPSSVALMAAGLLALGGVAARRRRA